MPKKILIIDDDLAILESLKICLEECGYEVETVDQIADSKNFINKVPDLVILDFLLSGRDGVQIAKSLRKNKKTSKVPIIMISAHPFAHRASKNAGVVEFLPKPFELDDLLKKIRKHT